MAAPLYHPFYCEENAWHLCLAPELSACPRSVVFISNPAGGFVMWHQRAARRPGAPLLWDYHVIVLAADPWEAWDLDTTLGLPVPAVDYLHRSFRADLPAELLPVFRIVDADELTAVFASDRSHMRGPDGRYRKPPPPWPPIGPPGAPSNLARFIDMDDPIAGEVLALDALIERLGAPEPATPR